MEVVLEGRRCWFEGALEGQRIAWEQKYRKPVVHKLAVRRLVELHKLVVHTLVELRKQVGPHKLIVHLQSVSVQGPLSFSLRFPCV